MIIHEVGGQERGTAGSIHPAAMPEWLAGDLILSWSNPGDTVLDPFAGAGTVGLMANKHGRKSFLLELNPDYCQIAANRVAGPSRAQIDTTQLKAA